MKTSVGLAFVLSSLLVVANALEDDKGYVEAVKQNFHDRINGQFEQQIQALQRLELAYKAYASFFDRSDVALPGFRKLFQQQEERVREHVRDMTEYVNQRGGRIRFITIKLEEACEAISKALVRHSVTSDKLTGGDGTPQPARNVANMCYFLLNPDPPNPNKVKSTQPPKPKDDIQNTVMNDVNEVAKEKFAKPQKEEKPTKPPKEEPEPVPHTEWPRGMYSVEDSLAAEKELNQALLSLVKREQSLVDPNTRHRVEENVNSQTKAIYDLGSYVTRLREFYNDGSYELGEFILDQELNKSLS